MRWMRLQTAVIGLAWCAAAAAAPQAAAPQEALEARVKKAHEAASANAATPEGRAWKEQKAFAIDRLMILILNRCLPTAPGDIPTAFSVYVRLSKAGQVREMVTELDAALSACLTTTARDVPFPDAPRDDYWFQVNMAAPL
jgi:hypothetical protein